jgi:hypothetical protein
MRYTIRHTFNTDADTFWSKLFFDPAYNETLFKQHLKFNLYNVLELQHAPDGSVHRRVECAPPVEVPAVVKKVIGDSTSYVEDGRFDPKTKRFTVEATPKVGADRIQTKMAMWVEPRGDKQIERIVEVDSNVKVFGVGKIIEGFIEKETRASYDSAAAFTNKWIAEKGL